ncbi:ABC transporter ATP-binding protein [Pelagibacterium halotolerans]|uniref:ABC transporter ATP-binding protein n=1 Tax=Pelagibacterium halotolerans TaxID=531813 RepID=UPI00385128F2
MKPIVLHVEGVGKCYAAYSSNMARFASWFGAKVRPVSEAWAVRDIGFTLNRGEALALIGQNGAGKSTLLKLITGTVRPTTGRISVAGRISAILELGLGFNPEFTGRQNVYQAGGLMGFSQEELTRLMPEIEDFAELDEYFDEPLRVYSSGMQARLAFSLATAVRPEVLIVDEVLSVGDSYFQHKSFDRIRQFKEEGTAILFVTHSMGDVRALCERVILLDQGKVLRDGPPDEVVDYYNALIAEKENAKLSIEQRRQKNGWSYTEFGDFRARVESIDLYRPGEETPIQMVKTGEVVEIRTVIRALDNLEQLVLGHRITDRTGHIIWGSNLWRTGQVIEHASKGQVIVSRLRFTCSLGDGSYAISYGVHRDDTHLAGCYHKADNKIVFDVINADYPQFIGTTHLDAAFDLEVVS